MIISRIRGCITNNAAEIPPTQAQGFRSHCGISRTVATAPTTMNNGTHNHEWNQKLPAKTARAETIIVGARLISRGTRCEITVRGCGGGEVRRCEITV